MADFSEQIDDQTLHIKFPESVNLQCTEQFQSQSKSWLLQAVDRIVLDFGQTASMDRSFFRYFIEFKDSIKGHNKELFSINLKPEVYAQLRDQGLVKAFNPVQNIHSNNSHKGNVVMDAKFDVELINPFLAATMQTLNVQANTPVTSGKPVIKSKGDYDVDVAGVISLVSDNFKGSIVLCFTQSVFLNIYKNMFEEEHTEINEEIQDAAGELLNIIYGQAKTELNKKGYNFKEALPTILVGQKLKVKQSGQGPVVIVPFESDAGAFHIELEFN